MKRLPEIGGGPPCPDGHGATLWLAQERVYVCYHAGHCGRPRTHPAGPSEPTRCAWKPSELGE